MCASYGLQIPASEVADLFQLNEHEGIAEVAAWLEQNAGETVKPTGRIAKNLNPIVRDSGAELAWWGYLVGGVPAKFPSINTRSERLLEKPGGLKGRALVPATEWFEFRKEPKEKWSFGTGELFAIGAVTQGGKPVDGDPVTCYSLVMQPAREDLEYIHDRMPLLIPQSFFDEWLGGDPTVELLEAALEAGRDITELVSARRV